MKINFQPAVGLSAATLYVARRMNIEAFLVIGTFTLLFGFVLYLPLYVWKKWKGKKAFPSDGALSEKISKRGITFCGVMVVFMLIGFAQEHLAPETEFGQFVSTWSGRMIYLVCVVIAFSLLGVVLAIFGFKVNDKNEKDV